MLLDPVVEHRKFDHEVALLEKNASRLRSLGAWIVRAERPEIDVMFVPRLSLRVALPVAATGPNSPTGSAPVLQGIEFPGAVGRAFGVRIDLRGYDQVPPSISFHDPWTWNLASYSELPIAQLVEDPARPQIVLLDAHPITKRPFLCLRGVREYHDHPQHDGDDWAIYRGAINVYAILERIARTALASVRPQVLIAVGGTTPSVPLTSGIQQAMQVQIVMQWAAEVPA